MHRKRDAMKFEAKLHGFEIQEETENFATPEQLDAFFKALAKRSNGKATIARR